MSTHYVTKVRGNEIVELFKNPGLSLAEAGHLAEAMNAADADGWRYRVNPITEMVPDYAENAYDRLVFRQSGV